MAPSRMKTRGVVRKCPSRPRRSSSVAASATGSTSSWTPRPTCRASTCGSSAQRGDRPFFLKDLSSLGTTVDGVPVRFERGGSGRTQAGHQRRGAGAAARRRSAWRRDRCWTSNSRAPETMPSAERAPLSAAAVHRPASGDNEDRYHCDPERGLFIVIDGVVVRRPANGLRKPRSGWCGPGSTGDGRAGRTAAGSHHPRQQRSVPPRAEPAGVGRHGVRAHRRLVRDGRLVAGHVGDTRLYCSRTGACRSSRTTTRRSASVRIRANSANEGDAAPQAKRGLQGRRF